MFLSENKKIDKSSRGATNIIPPLISFTTLQLGCIIIGEKVVRRGKSPLRLRALHVALKIVELINKSKLM